MNYSGTKLTLYIKPVFYNLKILYNKQNKKYISSKLSKKNLEVFGFFQEFNLRRYSHFFYCFM